jgi:hypothetical protein
MNFCGMMDYFRVIRASDAGTSWREELTLGRLLSCRGNRLTETSCVDRSAWTVEDSGGLGCTSPSTVTV